MELAYYQIFWNYGDMETFEYRYDKEVEALLNSGVIKRYTLIHWINN